MDPITAAIVAALAAGVAKSASTVGESVLVDGYTALKALLKKKFGGESKLLKAVDDLEDKPDSEGRRLTLKEEVKEARVDDDLQIRQAAQALLDDLRAHPASRQHVQQAEGSYIAQADRQSTAEVHVNQSNQPKP
jgi:hypothetical protein